MDINILGMEAAKNARVFQGQKVQKKCYLYGGYIILLICNVMNNVLVGFERVNDSISKDIRAGGKSFFIRTVSIILHGEIKNLSMILEWKFFSLLEFKKARSANFIPSISKRNG